MRRGAALLLLALSGSLACGKYGAPLRPSERERPAEEAAPAPQQLPQPVPQANESEIPQ